jgi:AcrR family transcriptional regulator
MTETLDLEHDAAAVGRRERKKQATRLALKAAALDLVAERGYAHVTVEDIAEAVDVSVRTFFNYFPSKEAAIVGDDPERIVAMKEELVSLPPQMPPLEAVRTVYLSRISAIEEDLDISGEDHTTWLRRFALVRSQPEVLAAFAKHLSLVEQALTDALVERLGGDADTRLYAALVASTSTAVMRAVGTCASGNSSYRSLRESADAAFDMFAAGLKPSRTGKVSS